MATPKESPAQTNEQVAASDGITQRLVPEDLGEYKGQYKLIGDESGEVYGLKVLDDADVRAHRTHTAKSALHFWDGTAEQFRALFDKV